MSDAEIQTLRMSEEHLREAIRRLCHFVPVAKNLAPDLHDFLIQHAVASLGTTPCSIDQIKGSLQAVFNLEFEAEEVRAAVQRSVQAGALLPSTAETWNIDIRKYEELSKSTEESKAFERKIMGDWLLGIRAKYPALSEYDLQAMEQDLMVYAAKVFVRHGAECVALIYAGENEVERFITEMEQEEDVFGSLPRRSAMVQDARIIELPSFFREAPSDRKKYIAELLDCTFILHTLHVDESCSRLMQVQIQEQTLYLDTNFLYRLLGLQGPTLHEAAKHLVEISQQLGCILVVSTRTIGEMQYSIERAVKQLKAHPLPRDLASVGAEYTTEESFMTAYWRKYAETGISIDDFFAIYQHLEHLFKEYTVEVVGTLCQEVQEDPELQEQITKLNSAMDYYGYYKAAPVAEHDAFHRLLIKRLRGKERRSWTEAKFWFLTCDTILPKFDRFARRNPKEMSFCMLPEQWLQLIRPLLPRSPDFDATFSDLLASPYLRSYGSLPPDTAQKILARIAQFREHSPALAFKILTDVYVAKGLRETEDEQEQLQIIDNATAQAAEKFRLEKEQTEAKLKETAAEREDLVEQRKDLSGKLQYEQVKFRWTITVFTWIVLALIGTLAIPWHSLQGFGRFGAVIAFVFAAIAALAYATRINKTFMKIFMIISGIAGILSLILSLV